MVKTKKVKKQKSDLNKVNSMTGKKAIGDFNEDFRVVPIVDMGNRSSNVVILKPLENGKENQAKKDGKHY